MIPSLEHFEELFRNYTQAYTDLPEISSSIRLKIEHTYKVLELGTSIAEELPSHLCFPLQLSCLFHDIGRFEQMKRYKTFSDIRSCNHAHLAIKILKKENFLASISDKERDIVYTAILLHNKQILTPLPEEMRLVALAVRDADKVDILRVMVENFEKPQENVDKVFLHVKDEPYYTPEVLETFLEGKSIKYRDLRYVNDFRLLLCGWLNEIYFASAFKRIKEENYYTTILAKLPDNEEIEKVRKYVLRVLEG